MTDGQLALLINAINNLGSHLGGGGYGGYGGFPGGFGGFPGLGYSG